MCNIEVSVIIPTFNRQPILRKTIEHICNQSFPNDKYEVIIIDDCSSDGTVKYLENLRLPVKFIVLQNYNNLGRAKTRNRGIRIARGKYILMIDDDIWATENLIENHLKIHQEHDKDIAVVGAVLASPEVLKTAINERCNDHHLWCFNEMKKYKNSLPYVFSKTANLSLSKSILLDIGLFNESFIYYGGEDTELGYRLKKNNIELIFAEKAIGYHYHNETVESLIAKELELGKSFVISRKLHPELRLDTNTFFSPFYHRKINLRSMIYNLTKLLLFNPVARTANRLFIKFFNEKRMLRTLLVKYLISILKMQYYRYSMRRAIE